MLVAWLQPESMLMAYDIAKAMSDRVPDAFAGVQADDAAEVLTAVKAAQHVDTAVQVGC